MRLRPATMVLFVVLALSGATAGAAEIKVNYDRQADFTRYKTWRWRKGTPAANPVADKQLRDAIESRLAARGLSRVESRGDLEVVYHAADENKIGVEKLGYKQPDFEAQATQTFTGRLRIRAGAAGPGTPARPAGRTASAWRQSSASAGGATG
jgi:Domain of unknown function (DUF4136)